VRPTLRSEVPLAILALLEDRGAEWIWTTRELADALNLKEYAVRGSVSTLLLREEVRTVGRVTRRTPSGFPYFAMTYQWNGPRRGAPDVAALYRAFGLG
jgi:hypothetical protein